MDGQNTPVKTPIEGASPIRHNNQVSTLADINDATRTLSLDELKELMLSVSRQVREKEATMNMSPRMANLHKGMVWVAEDFDASLSDEFWAGADA